MYEYNTEFWSTEEVSFEKFHFIRLNKENIRTNFLFLYPY